MKNNLILALLSSAFLLGCAAKYQSISPDVGVALTIENKGAAVMANIHTDNQCTKLPNGDWLGSIGEMKISSMSEYQKTVYVAPNKSMTLYMEWYDLGAYSNDCVQTATFSPEEGQGYFAEYSWEENQCKLVISSKGINDSSFKPLLNSEVRYGNNHCSH